MKTAVNIRMPSDMKKVLDLIAENEFRSLNSVILQYLNEKLIDMGIEWREESKQKSSKQGYLAALHEALVNQHDPRNYCSPH